RPVLTFYNPEYETQLHTDASKNGIAGILLQRPNKESPFSAVAYYSRQTSPEESRFTSYDLETLAVVASMQRFRVYLLGVPFTVVTDCNSLRATFEKKDMLPRVARWWGTMQEYDFNIIYKPGATMGHVDALSRNPIADKEVLDILNIDSNWIVTVQQSDPELQRIVNILNDPETKNLAELKNNFIVKRGLLYRNTSDGERWVVPKGVRWQILKANHDNIGHFGFDKTFDKIRRQYWFAKMRRFIKKYIDSCLECAHHKIPSGKKAGELHPIQKVECPFHTVHVDHLGPF
ncbi:jg14098, partial [Pararge aegeria aegeria]